MQLSISILLCIYFIGFVAAIVVEKAANASVKFIYLVLVGIMQMLVFFFGCNIILSRFQN